MSPKITVFRYIVVLSVAVGNRGSLVFVILGTPKIDGEMGEEARDRGRNRGVVKAFSTVNGDSSCHPICRRSLELITHLSIF